MAVARWSCCTSWSRSLLCGERTSERCFANSSAFSLSLFAHGPGGVEYLRIGGDVFGFLLFYRFPNRVIFPFKITNVVFKVFIPHFLGFGFYLLLVPLYILLLSCVRVLCQIDLAVLFSATSLLIS